MLNVSLGKKRFERGALGLVIIACLFLMSPGFASASTLMPTRVLPPNTGKACAPVTTSEVMAYVYDGNLDSFDITLSDSRYVALSTSAGDQVVPFNYISRWANPDGSVRMHVDLQSIQLNKDVKIQITFLSSQTEEGNRITCVFSVPATVPALTVVGNTGNEGGQAPSVPVGNSGGATTGGHTSGSGSTSGSGTKNPSGSLGSTTSTSTMNPGLVSASSSLGNLCANGGGGRLWIVLLVLYAIFAFTLCAQTFTPDSKTREWNIGLLLAVFAGLLVFWYMSSMCRTGSWAPAVATLIALGALLYTMLKPSGTQEILLLRDGKK